MTRGTRSGREDYGTDAPYVPAGYAAGALGCAVLAVLAGPWWGIPAVAAAAGAGVFLHATWRGKFVAWERLLDRLDLRGDEHVLDVGCGRGAVTVAVARRVPRGHVVGVDLWRRQDQSGNDPGAARANLAAAGIADRVALQTADMRALPFADASFDLVVSSLAVHNLGRREDRDRAIDEMHRVLRPGGHLVVADLAHTEEYRARLRSRGVATVRSSLGWRVWWTGPWMATYVVRRVPA